MSVPAVATGVSNAIIPAATPGQMAVSLAAPAVNGLFGFLGARRQNRHQIRLAKRAEAHNLKMWQMQADYNSPEAQMARLEAAGLNPNLIYGEGARGAAGNQSDYPRAELPQVQNEIIHMQIPILLELLDKMWGMTSKRQDVVKGIADVNLIRNKTTKEALEWQFLNETFDDRKKYLEETIKYTQNKAVREKALAELSEMEAKMQEELKSMYMTPNDHIAGRLMLYILKAIGINPSEMGYEK